MRTLGIRMAMKRRKRKDLTSRMVIHSLIFQTKLRCTSLRRLAYEFLLIVTDKELDLVHSRLFSLERLRLSRFGAHLQRLCLRQNFIATLDPEVFSHLCRLVDLDLYDNKIRHVGDALNSLKELT